MLLDLNGADRRLYNRTLASSHRVRVRLLVLSLDGDHLSHLTPRLLDGQVDVDATAEVTRSLTLSVFDPRHALNFDSSSPADGAMFADRMLRVMYDVRVEGLGWVPAAAFTGPVTRFARDKSTVTLEAQGKEALALESLWRPITVKKGTLKTDAIRRIMRATGEDRFSFPELSERLPRDLSLGREDRAWTACLKIAKSMDRQLYYDGRGTCRLRRHPEAPVFTFAEGVHITSGPTVSFSVDDLDNVVWVKGGKPKGAHNAPKAGTDDDGDDTPVKRESDPGVRGKAVAPHGHPLGPWALGRNGEPIFRLKVVDDDHVRSQTVADKTALRLLRQSLNQDVTWDFQSMPVAHLDPLDPVRVKTSDFSRTMPLKRWSLPLTVAGGAMTVGSNNRRSVRRNRIR